MHKEMIRPLGDFLDSWLGYRAQQCEVPGFTVAVGWRGKIVYSAGFGVANLDTREPMRPNHIFSIASQSKMFTATAVMMLAERGRLGMDDRLSRHLPWLKQHTDKQAKSITVWQLLWHGAGLLRDGCAADYWQLMRPFPGDDELKQMVLDAKLVVGEYSQLKYSNLGYALLGQLVAAVSGRSFSDFVEDEILKPLGMKDTFMMPPEGRDSRLATCYLRPMSGQRIAVPSKVPMRAFTPVAGIYSTAQDMCRFAAEHYGCGLGLLSGVHYKAMHQRSRSHWQPQSRRGTPYGLGFQLFKLAGRDMAGHSGSGIGCRSATFFDDKSQIAVSVCANAKDAGAATRVLEGVLEAVAFYHANWRGDLPQHLKKFATRIVSQWSTLQIVPTAKKIVVANLDSWRPFDGAAQLEYADTNTLNIVSAHDLDAPKEQVVFYNNYGELQVVYAGNSYFPEGAFAARTRQVFRRFEEQNE
jgi:D-alanyl-D-alanine carboxypeptidase